MKIRPRQYQAEAVGSIYSYFESGMTGNPLLLMPTGTGKAVVIALFLESVFKSYPNQKILNLTHVKELVEQNYKKLLELWPTAPAGVNSAGLNRRDYMERIIFAGIGSVAKTPQLFGRVDLLLIDEAHLVSPNDETMYQQFIKELLIINPNLKVIGFTATGWRLGQGKITDDGIFTDVCFDITSLHAFNRLIAEGYLSPLIPRKTQLLLDTSGVHMQGGEFKAGELQLAVNKDEITYAAIKETIELAEDRKHWLIFASGLDHCDSISHMLTSLNISNVVIHTKLTNKERDERILLFKSGQVMAAVNNNVLTTGFDYPEIDLIVVLRPTLSTVLWVQMLGRGTRPVYAGGFDLDSIEGRLLAIEHGPKQNCLVLDFAGNTRKLGPINDPVIPRKKGQKGGDAPVKLCEMCDVYNHASVTHCFNCGAEFVFKVKLKGKSSGEELIKNDAPIVDVFKVDVITYHKHEKVGAALIMKVSYYCGLRMFQEYICIEHEGYALRNAKIWWRERANNIPFPMSTTHALEVAEHLIPPTHLRVWVNKKYPEILSYCFDGTAFKTIEAPADLQLPQVSAEKARPIQELVSQPRTDSEWDDDIPF